MGGLVVGLDLIHLYRPRADRVSAQAVVCTTAPARSWLARSSIARCSAGCLADQATRHHRSMKALIPASSIVAVASAITAWKSVSKSSRSSAGRAARMDFKSLLGGARNGAPCPETLRVSAVIAVTSLHSLERWSDRVPPESCSTNPMIMIGVGGRRRGLGRAAALAEPVVPGRQALAGGGGDRQHRGAGADPLQVGGVPFGVEVQVGQQVDLAQQDQVSITE